MTIIFVWLFDIMFFGILCLYLKWKLDKEDRRIRAFLDESDKKIRQQIETHIQEMKNKVG